MSAPRVVFAGTPEFAVPALDALHSSACRLVAVLTQPDRPAGRGRKLQMSAVAARARRAGVPVMQPTRLNNARTRAAFTRLEPDLLITAAYGLLVPSDWLAVPRFGCWNLHASLLPRWRGASPIQQAILAGDKQTGISLMQMDAGLDTGPVLLQQVEPILADDTAGSLHDRLAGLAAELVVDGLTRLVAHALPPATPQNEARATHAPLIHRADAILDWNRDAGELARQVRAYHPWPVASAWIADLECRIHQAEALDLNAPRPGVLVHGHEQRDRVIVSCGRGALAIASLQAPGRRPVSARDWLNAHPDWA